jgi:hypothetical protein
LLRDHVTVGANLGSGEPSEGEPAKIGMIDRVRHAATEPVQGPKTTWHRSAASARV